MSFQDLLRDTLATLWAHKRRTMLTMFGIAWGIISITVMVAAGEGLGVGIQKKQENFCKDVMIVFAGRTSMQAGGARSGRRVRWGEDDYVQVVKEAPACKYVMPELGNDVQVHSLFQQRHHSDRGFSSSVHGDSQHRCRKAASTTRKTTPKPATWLFSAVM